MMQNKKTISIYDHKGCPLQVSYDALFQLETYPLLEEQETFTYQNDPTTREIMSTYCSLLFETRKEVVNAYKRKDWKTIIFVADRERDGALYTRAVRLSYACEFLRSYYLTDQTFYLNALYKQLISTIDQTLKVMTSLSFLHH